MKPHESPRINKKSIRGNSGDSWPVWNRGIKWQPEASGDEKTSKNPKSAYGTSGIAVPNLSFTKLTKITSL